eukprot:1291430-Prymnesium_polylepis.2
MIDSLVKEHLLGIKVTPHMPYTQDLGPSGQPGERPPKGTVEEQEVARSNGGGRRFSGSQFE